MDMLSSVAAEAWLKRFCTRYANRQRIHDIPTGDREQWGALNIETRGIHIPTFMTVAAWGATPGTLTTAATLIRRYAASLLQDDAVSQTVALLEDAARRQKTQNRTMSAAKVSDRGK